MTGIDYLISKKKKKLGLQKMDLYFRISHALKASRA